MKPKTRTGYVVQDGCHNCWHQDHDRERMWCGVGGNMPIVRSSVRGRFNPSWEQEFLARQAWEAKNKVSPGGKCDRWKGEGR